MKKTIKKILLITASLVVISLLLISCGNNTEETPDEPENTTPSTTAETEASTDAETTVSTSVFDTPTAPSNVTVEKVFKAPEGDKRQVVLDYMLKMAKIEWTPAVDFVTTHAPGEEKDYEVNLEYKAGKTYYGVPYANTKANYDEFTEYLDGNVFSCDSYYYGEIIGNHCSSSMFLAYQQIIPVEYGTLRPSEARQGIFKLAGNLKNPGAGTWYSRDVFDLNGEDAVYEAYTTLGAGDILFKCISGSGHTRMVTKVEVFKTAAGKISPARSYVYVVEQTNGWYDSNQNSTWWVDKRYTFSDLYDKLFMPITLDTYHDDSELTDAYIWFTGKNSADMIQTKLVGRISSNYPLNYIRLTIEDADGNVVRTMNKNNLSKFIEVDISREYYDLKINELPAGTYKYTLRAGIARGACELESFEFTIG